MNKLAHHLTSIERALRELPRGEFRRTLVGDASGVGIFDEETGQLLQVIAGGIEADVAELVATILNAAAAMTVDALPYVSMGRR